MQRKTSDVIIAGGGLAGMSLAYQLKQNTPDLSISVIERNKFPVPKTTAKVGESTVEIASHYLSETLGFKEHFQGEHLRKYGLRCFFGEPQNDFSEQDELGVSQLFGIPTYQLDRGVIENHLYEQITDLGVDVIDAATTHDISLSAAKQSVQVGTAEGELQLESRWLVDAAGRQQLIKNKKGLNLDNGHKGNALWFRIDRQIKIDDWSSNSEWQDRLTSERHRWLSTNHLMGPGYWVWVIPLGTGATSIGIVMDDQALAESGIENYEDTIAWLEKHQPRCAAAVHGAKVLDFVLIRDYSFGCKQMFSQEGWGLTGEAGAFADPFYSPGSDFIAISNTFLTHLIGKSCTGQNIQIDSKVFEIFFDSFFESTLSLYSQQYGGFGDRKMMSIKLVWDFSYYWGVLTLLFYKNAIIDIALIREMNPQLQHAQSLNRMMQSKFRQRASKRFVLPAQGLFLNQYPIPCLQHFNDILKNTDNVDTRKTLDDNITLLTRIAAHLQDMLEDKATLSISDGERELFGDYRHSVLA